MESEECKKWKLELKKLYIKDINKLIILYKLCQENKIYEEYKLCQVNLILKKIV